jgi:outer membrane protein OmpA-like peptidoglycan-associated protein
MTLEDRSSPQARPCARLNRFLPPTHQCSIKSLRTCISDFNRANLTAADISALQRDAEWLKAHHEATFTIEGDADQRGSIPYNLFLSDERALAARDQLVKLGVPAKQIPFAEGWGKLYPDCQQVDESCWSKQRRAHLAAWSPESAPATSAQGNAIVNDVIASTSADRRR